MLQMKSIIGRDMYKEFGCIAQFSKNETTAMFFLKKPSLVSNIMAMN